MVTDILTLRNSQIKDSGHPTGKKPSLAGALKWWTRTVWWHRHPFPFQSMYSLVLKMWRFYLLLVVAKIFEAVHHLSGSTWVNHWEMQCLSYAAMFCKGYHHISCGLLVFVNEWSFKSSCVSMQVCHAVSNSFKASSIECISSTG